MVLLDLFAGQGWRQTQRADLRTRGREGVGQTESAALKPYEHLDLGKVFVFSSSWVIF